MNLIVCSDIHSNKEALQTFCEDISSFDYSGIIFLGDLIGYNPDPEEAVKTAMKWEKEGKLITKISGNHDNAVLDLNNANRFNSNARRAIIWTAENISETSMKWLKSMTGPVKINEKAIACHGSIRDSNEYIFNEDIALDNFLLFPRNIQMAFFGHTHVPIIYELKNDDTLITHWMNEEIEFFLDERSKYLINPGSVGQPRNGDNRLSYIIWDTKKNVIHYKKKNYNYIITQKKIYEAKLPEISAMRLEEGY